MKNDRCAASNCDSYRYNNSTEYCIVHRGAFLRYGDPLYNKPKARTTYGAPKNHTLYGTWRTMIHRCTNPLRKDYKNYGAVGVKVCDRWLHSFQKFIDDVGDKPHPSYTLDRIDPHGNYEPTNCRWASPLTQGINKRQRGTSTKTGVHYSKHLHKWVSRLTVNKELVHQSFHDDEKDAIESRVSAEELYLNQVYI